MPRFATAAHTTTSSPRSVTATWTSRTSIWPLPAGSGEPRLPSERTRAAHTRPERSANATAAGWPPAASAATIAPETATPAPTVCGGVKPVGGAACANGAAASARTATEQASSERGIVLPT